MKKNKISVIILFFADLFFMAAFFLIFGSYTFFIMDNNTTQIPTFFIGVSATYILFTSLYGSMKILQKHPQHIKFESKLFWLIKNISVASHGGSNIEFILFTLWFFILLLLDLVLLPIELLLSVRIKF